MAARTFFASALLAASLIMSSEAQEHATVRSFGLRDAELRAALDSLLRWYSVPLVYLERDVTGKRISADCRSCSFDDALAAVLAGQRLTTTRIDGQVVIRASLEDETATLAGTIIDSLTQEPLSGASILLTSLGDPRPYRWSSTGPSGFFSLRNVAAGRYRLIIRRIGYYTHEQPLSVSAGAEDVEQFRLRDRELVQPRVTVEGQRSGFAAADGISRGVFIRSAPSDHNQYYLEGARIYNPVHFGGLTSAFNGDAQRDVQLVASGVPPFYGGRIGGVLDVSLRNGSPEGIAGSAEAGTIGSGLLLEGPVAGPATFLFSGRLGYPDGLSSPPSGMSRSDLRSSELMLKLSRPLPSDQRVSAVVYAAGDGLDKGVTGLAGTRLDNTIRWWNDAASIRWRAVAGPSLYLSAAAAYTVYGFRAGHRWSPSAGSTGLFDSRFSIEDAALRAHAEYAYDELHTVLAGVELVRHRLSGSIGEFSSQMGTMSLDGRSPWELSVYFEDQWRLLPSVLAAVGARATSFVAQSGSASSVDPRFSLLVTLDDARRISASISAVNQYLHPYRHSGIFLFYPSIFLYPSDGRIPPSTSLHAAVGFENLFPEDRYRFAAESYYRITRNLHEFAADSARPNGDIADALLVGEGASYGAEVRLDKRTGVLTGSIRYGLSWSWNRFAELNNGEPFRPRFDRRHELFATFDWTVSEDWVLGGTCLLAASQFPSFSARGLEEKSVTPTVDAGMITRSSYAEPFDLNGGRLPGFQRIELRASYSFDMLGQVWEGTIRMLNGYGLFDPFDWQLSNNADPRLRWRVSFDAPPLFPLYPAVSLRMKF